ncbi:hypothetical protein QFC19_003346 [Naganishia cerealis]|uniref:Uncharacterized protein n=1 Tax=Naganishia cerealis TaxID=610337 RepID=A0ACC2W3W1_9TREE|nr:hypothetical protein QFC19_003346 [Naganishia cerealis]
MSNFFSSSALRFSRAALPIAAVGGLLHRGFTEANGAETIEFPVPQQLDSPGFGTSPDTITGSPAATPAERQFYTASSFPIPKEWTGAAFEIHKEYPKGLRPEAEAPWLETDFKREPERSLIIWTSMARSEPSGLADELVFSAGYCGIQTTDEQVPTMKGSPGFEALDARSALIKEERTDCRGRLSELPHIVQVIAQQLDPTVAPKDGGIRNNSSSLVRLLQVDFGVRDNRSITGWVWGTFMYDGGVDKSDWGNDPDLSQAAYEKGERPKETWLSPKAEKIRIALGGTRPSWGGNGRLNGPASRIHGISTIASPNHKLPPLVVSRFRNIVPSTTFELPGISADNSQQLRMGYENFQEWIARQLVNGEQASPDEPKGKEEVN